MTKKILLYTFSLFSFIGCLEAYQGKLQCKGLQEKLAYFPHLHVGRFCSQALDTCDLRVKLKALKPDHPLRQEMEEDFNRRFKLNMETCELALFSYDPGYYESRLKRGASVVSEENEPSNDTEDQDTIDQDINGQDIQ